MPVAATSAPVPYLLGDEPSELDRLAAQAEVLARATRQILRLAGIAPGMRVLDLGSGAGDLAFEVAEQVGPLGSVIGVDRSRRAVAFAERRRQARGFAHVSFVHADLHGLGPLGTFDAVVGRLILLHVPDPAGLLRRLARQVRSGGVVAAMEYEMTSAGALPETVLVHRLVGWIIEGFARSGLDPLLGARLARILGDAGLVEVGTLAFQEYLPYDHPLAAAMPADVLRSLLPALEAHGVVRGEAIGFDTLPRRIAASLRAADALFKPPALVGAWSRVP